VQRSIDLVKRSFVLIVVSIRIIEKQGDNMKDNESTTENIHEIHYRGSNILIEPTLLEQVFNWVGDSFRGIMEVVGALNLTTRKCM
jgi:hypothetical protein